jgi:hypothetical protein
MGEITGIFIVGFIVLGVYKLVELYAKRKERLLMIEKLTIVGEDKEGSGEQLKIRLPFSFGNDSDFGFWPLRISLLLIGIGAGCLMSFFFQIIYFTGSSISWNLVALINFASISMLGGIGLLIAYFIEQKKRAKN